jgi:hypothetical protein
MPGEVVVAVRVRPGASRTRVGGCHQGARGAALVVAVTAPATGGRATEAARRALAEALAVRPAAVALHHGATSRDKLFTVPAATAERVRALRDQPAPGRPPRDPPRRNPPRP